MMAHSSPDAEDTPPKKERQKTPNSPATIRRLSENSANLRYNREWQEHVLVMLPMAWKAPIPMEPEYTTQLQHILERMTVGVAILDCATLRVLYANSYLTSFCPEPWKTLGLVGRLAGEILPADIYRLAEPLFQQVCADGRKVSLAEIPY